MRQIKLSTIDTNLFADLNKNSTYTAFEAVDPDGLDYHIVFNGSRGGIAQIGSGSDGSTHWTDAATAAEVLDRYIADNMRP